MTSIRRTRVEDSCQKNANDVGLTGGTYGKAKKTAEDAVDLDTQIDKFIKVKVSADFSALKKIKETLSKSIKDLLGKREAYDSPFGEVTYGYNEDGEKKSSICSSSKRSSRPRGKRA